MKRLIIISLVILTSILTPVYGDIIDGPFLILNADNFPWLPRNFRTSGDKVKEDKIVPQGLSELNIAGGGQVSEQALIKVIENVPQLEWIVDLRQESHGYAAGFPISWYGEHNWANLAKQNQEVEQDQSERLASLKKKNLIFLQNESIKGGITRVLHKDFWFPLPVILPSTAVTDEKTLAKNYGLKYARFYVSDHRRPSDDEVEGFIEFIKTVPQDSWIYFHCAAGIGRTTTFMAMYDMVYNAKNVSFDDIIVRQHKIGGKNLASFEKTSSFKYQYSVERYAFLKEFYRYAQANDDGFQTPWKQWLETEGEIVHMS